MSAPPKCGSWSAGRFWTVAAALFILQVGLLWSFAERQRKPPLPDPPAFAALLLARPVEQGNAATALFAEDPTLFQEARPRGFSGRAWMDTPSPEYHAAEHPAPEVWLTMETGWHPSLHSTAATREAPFILARPSPTEFEPASAYLAPQAQSPPSAMHLGGALANRALLTPVGSLPPQPSLQLVNNTIAQVAVDAAGQVVSARITGASGLAAADATALGIVRALRFAPVEDSRGAVAWGDAVFSWQTIQPAAPPAK